MHTVAVQNSPRPHRNDLKGLFASGDNSPPIPRPLSRPLRPLAVFGVLAQKQHMYTLGIDHLVMLMHLPCSHISHDSL